VAEGYTPIDPLTESSIGMLQNHLHTANAVIETQAKRIAYLEAVCELLAASGGTIDVAELHRRGF
jgi:hypothetical protein